MSRIVYTCLARQDRHSWLHGDGNSRADDETQHRREYTELREMFVLGLLARYRMNRRQLLKNNCAKKFIREN